MTQKTFKTDFLNAAVSGDCKAMSRFFAELDDIDQQFQHIIADLDNILTPKPSLVTVKTHMQHVAKHFARAAHVEPSLYKSILHDLTVSLAAYYGHEALYMQSAPIAPASPPGDIYMFLRMASDGGQYNILADMCERHNMPIDFDDNTALIQAIQRDDLEAVQKICENHVINPAKPCTISPVAQAHMGTEKADALFYAVHAGHHNIATYLMQSQDLDPIAHNGAALTAAQLYKRPHLLDEMLLQHVDKIPANTAFHFCQYLAEQGDIKRLNTMCENEQINLNDHAQPLFEGAFSQGNIQIIDFITQHINPQISDFSETTWKMFGAKYNKANHEKRCIIYAQICGADISPFATIDRDAYDDVMQAYQKTMKEHEASLQQAWHKINRHILREKSSPTKTPIKRRPKPPHK